MISELVTVFSLVLLIVVLALECWKFYLNQTKLKPFVQLKGLPVIGKAIFIIGKDNAQIVAEFGSQTDKLCYTWLGPDLFFLAGLPEDFEAILSSDKLLKKAFVYGFLNNRTGLLTAEPHIWKQHRRALNPTLGLKMVTSFIPIFNEKFKKMTDLMERQMSDAPVDMHQIMFSASIEAILSTSFGVDWTMQNQRGKHIHDIIVNIMEGIQVRVQRIWLWNPIYRMTKEYKREIERFYQLYRFCRGALEAKKMDLAEKLEVHGEDEIAIAKENCNLNFLQKCLQLEKEQKFDDENVCEELETLFIGGTDTSASTVNGAILMLAIHQEYQQRVFDELHDIFEDVNEPVTAEHLTRMTFMELVIKESMRHFPLLPYMARECTADFPINGGVIPKGSMVVLNVLRMNKNPKLWGENAHEFYPERFLPENSADMHPYLYVPFSAGPRNCIGKRYGWVSVKIAVAYLLRRFKFVTDIKMHQVEIKPELLIKISNKDAVRIERRQW